MNGTGTAHTARRLLAERGARLLLSAAAPELREAYEGDLHERLEQAVVAERGVDGARRWLRRELARSLPRMLGRRATSGAHPMRRAALACSLIAVGLGEVAFRARTGSLFGLFGGADVGPVSTDFAWLVLAAFAFAVVVRARTAISTLWFVLYFVGTPVRLAERSSDALPITGSALLAVSLAVALRLPWNVFRWRFLTTWQGGLETLRRRRPTS